MDIQFYGANCIAITTKQIRLVIDDNLESIGGKTIIRDGDVALFTSSHDEVVPRAKMTIDIPGEYEAQGITVRGIQARAHMDTENERNGVIYKITVGETRILVTGHIFPKLSESRLEEIGLVDILIVPVGGNGFTLDPVGALQIIKEIEPKLVIPTHYDDTDLQFEVPQQNLDDALKTIGIVPLETTKKLQYKASETAEATQLVVLEKA